MPISAMLLQGLHRSAASIPESLRFLVESLITATLFTSTA